MNSAGLRDTVPGRPRGSGPFCLVLMLGILCAAGVRAQEEMVQIENGLYQVEVARSNGVIRRIRGKRGGPDLLAEPRLADNFKFSLPLPGDAAWQATEANYIEGKDQRLTSYTTTDDRLVLRWNGPLQSVSGRPAPLEC